MNQQNHIHKLRRIRFSSITSILTSAALLIVLLVSVTQPARAAVEDILAGAFDAITGVPFASTMLGIVREGESLPQSPKVLDARLAAVEALLRNMEPRLKLVEQRLKQLQNEVVKVSNVNRLRKLQQLHSDLALINAELRTKPTDPGARSILEFRARQQADLLKNDPDFDVWNWSDVSGENVRNRFLVYPTFEVYALAITTWFSAIELNSGTQPQRVVADFGRALREHQTFLETRLNFKELVDEPLSLPEHLSTAAFCRLEAVDKFSNASGNCVFASVCIDTMAGKSAETGRLTLTMQPARAGVLCTTSPSQSLGLKGEEELRNSYGAELMAALAHSLGRLATTGSLRDPFVGQFPSFIQAQLFSVPLDAPFLTSPGAAQGTSPGIPTCRPLIGGCSFGVTLSQKTGWTIAKVNPSQTGGTVGLNTIKSDANTLCLDVDKSAAVLGASVVVWPCNGSPSQVWNFVRIDARKFSLASGSTKLCATVVPAPPSKVALTLSRSLSLQPCDTRALQQFSTTDSTLVGPH